MQLFILYLRLHAPRLAIAALALALVSAVGYASLHARDAAPDATAPGDARTAATAPIAAPAAAPAAAPVSQDQVAVPQPAPDLQPSVLAGLNCARQQASLPALVLDARLADDAAALGRAVALHPGRPLAELGASAFAFVALVPLPSDGLESQVADAATHCRLGDIDASQLGLPGALTSVGIAVFEDASPRDAWDSTTAVIVAR